MACFAFVTSGLFMCSTSGVVSNSDCIAFVIRVMIEQKRTTLRPQNVQRREDERTNKVKTY